MAPTVKVPQADGEIVITRNGESRTYKVSDHEVTVKEAELDRFLDSVEGASKVAAKPAASAKEGN